MPIRPALKASFLARRRSGEEAPWSARLAGKGHFPEAGRVSDELHSLVDVLGRLRRRSGLLRAVALLERQRLSDEREYAESDIQQRVERAGLRHMIDRQGDSAGSSKTCHVLWLTLVMNECHFGGHRLHLYAIYAQCCIMLPVLCCSSFFLYMFNLCLA